MGIKVRKYTNQILIYWKKIGSDSTGGARYDSPVEVACRWDDNAERELMSAGRKVIQSGTMIMTSTKLVEGSLVMLGTLDEWKTLPYYPNTPSKLQGGHEVVRSSHIPDKKGRELLYITYL